MNVDWMLAMLAASITTMGLIGTSVGLHSQAAAWRRIAEERRWNWEQRTKDPRD
jgi:hypothetical protein